MVQNALDLFYYTIGKCISFLLGATIGTDGVGSVSLLFIYFAVFLFGILFRFVLSVPRTYRGQSDGDYKYNKMNDNVDRMFRSLKG